MSEPPPAPATPEDALARVGRAFSHPLRIRLVLALDDLGEASPLQLARHVGSPLATVSYHVRYLANLGAIELQRMVPRRGALQHYYILADPVRRVLPQARQLRANSALAKPPKSD